MANEYLQRTPTSTGNRRVWTWSAWIKQSKNSANQVLWCARPTSTPYTQFQLSSSTGTLDFYDSNAPASVVSTQYQRDFSSWYNIIISVDTTQTVSSNRVIFYLNGVRVRSLSTATFPNQNDSTNVNALVNHTIGRLDYDNSQFLTSEIADVFFVDGQALTPDVFGFYKEGKGYISAGSTQATDFRPGQWVPKTPRVIKAQIERNGGFGVNGFYLPMNDSSNFGADFHCEPNSIITLKGEDLPQPRNGAPETTDAYVSQLRSDPYAANLVLAIPGISTATGANLVTNGTFENGTTGWTISNASHGTMTVNSNNQLLLSQTTGGGDGVLHAWQAFTTEIGKRYTVIVEIVGGTASSTAFYVNNSSSFGNAFGSATNNSGNGFKSVSFQATGTTAYILLRVNTTTPNVTSIFDNIVVRQEDAPRDYSADIKGSGTNKVVQATLGTGGVGYELGGYYGSAINANDNNCGHAFSGADSAFICSGDFTVEFWLDPVVATQPQGNPRILGQTNNSGGKWDIYIDGTDSTNRIYIMGGSVALTGGNGSSYGNFVPGQWNHFCLERSGSTMTTYMNGVAVYSQTYTNTIGTTDFLYLGSYGDQSAAPGFGITGKIQDFRFYKGVAKYKGGFDVPKPYTPVGIATWRAVPDTTANNFATQQPTNASSLQTLTAGNLDQVANTAGWNTVRGTIGISTGKYYWEVRMSGTTNTIMVGVDDNLYQVITNPSSAYVGAYTNSWSVYFSDGNKRNNTSSGSAYGSSFAQGDICMVALDIINGKIYWGKNGTWFNSGDPVAGTNAAYTNLTGYSHIMPAVSCFDSNSGVNLNFGQNPTFSGNTTTGTFTDSNGKGLFKYEPPSGFLSLCEDNLPTPAISNPGDYFKTVLYTGNGVPATSKSVVGVGFTPDLVWIKRRDGSTGDHKLVDSVRGAGFVLETNTTDIEGNETNNFTSFADDGFNLGANNATAWNESANYVAWCWRAGAGTTSTNTDGSITSVVSVNQTAGFSIVTFTANTGTGSIGHGLGVPPKMMIIKSRNNPSNWVVYHASLGAGKYLNMNTTDAAFTNTSTWQNTTPTSTVFYSNGPFTTGWSEVTYCWAEIEGYSKFGSYVGNGNADGPFVYTGGKPALILTKRTDTTSSWHIVDNARGSTNPVIKTLYPEGSYVEGDETNNSFDFLSNGFKIRGSSTGVNASGGTYIYACFMESPFTTANAK
jgi:hypothetical protein